MIFKSDDFTILPQVLIQGIAEPENNRRGAATIEEVLVAELGDSHKEPHLLVYLG